MRNARKIAAALAATLLLAWVLYTLASLQLTDQQSRADRAAIRQQVAQAQADQQESDQKVGLLAQQLEALGETPVAEPDEPLPPNLQTIPIPVPTEPEFSVVLDAVRDQIDGALQRVCDGSCEGTDGRTLPPADPLPPLPALVPRDGIDGKPGADGKNGTDGKDGKDGRGIASVSCSATGLAVITQTFTYTDGTTETVTCDVLPPVEPTPDPTPEETP